MHPYYVCPDATRIGDVGDGGKWICGVSRLTQTDHKCLVYSFGSNSESSFETQLSKATGNQCEIHIFDPTTGAAPGGTFHSWGLSAKTGTTRLSRGSTQAADYQVKTLRDTMQALGHEKRFIDVLKIDIEGSEWDAFEDILKEPLDFVGQIQVELHIGALQWRAGPAKISYDMLLNVVRRLYRNKLLLFSMELNYLAGEFDSPPLEAAFVYVPDFTP